MKYRDIAKNDHCVSTTGVVHHIKFIGRREVWPLCNSNNGPFFSEYFKSWERTDKPVTCKTCLRLAMIKIDKHRKILDRTMSETRIVSIMIGTLLVMLLFIVIRFLYLYVFDYITYTKVFECVFENICK